MENYGFEIEVNGKKVRRAGFDNTYFVVSCILHSLHRKFDKSKEVVLHVGGLNSETEEHVDWFGKDLELGDKITVEVIDGPFDEPVPRKTQWSEEEMPKRKIEHYYALKEELKEHLNE